MPEIKQSYYLQQEFHFTDSDLKANQAGKLTRKQSKYLINLWITPFTILMFFIVLVLGVGGFFVTETVFERFLLLLLVSPFLFAVAYFFRAFLDAKEDMTNGIVMSETGILQRNSQYSDYRICLGDEGTKFRISETAYNLVKQGQIYTVYYLPRTQMIVSIEQSDRETLVRELKDELKYLQSLEASLKAKNKANK